MIDPDALPLSEDENVRTAAQLLDGMQAHVNPGMARLFRFLGLDAVEWSGAGVWVEDIAGRRYLDFASSYGVTNLGHRHPRVMAAVRDQLERLPMATRLTLNAPQIALAQRLAEAAPGELEYAFFCNSGAEAVEAALKLARAASGRTEVIATAGGFHGKTLGALSAMGNQAYREPFEPLVPGFTSVPFGDAGALAAAVTDRTAAVMLEPIQGEAGVIVPPDGYLQAARRICDTRGALLILDEVQTGMGRTGYLFGCEHEGVTPDLLCLAKALGGGIMPIGAVLGTPDVFAFLDSHPLGHSSTFGGNPLACAAAMAALDVTVADGLPARGAAVGTAVMAALRELQTAHPVLTDVRGRGAMIGLSFADPGAGALLLSTLVEARVLILPSLNDLTHMRVFPPLISEEAHVSHFLERFGAALAEVDEAVAQMS